MWGGGGGVGVDGSYHGVVYGKFGEDQIKILPIGLEKAKNVILARKTHEATGLNLGMYTQFDFGNNMGWVPPDCTSSF